MHLAKSPIKSALQRPALQLEPESSPNHPIEETHASPSESATEGRIIKLSKILKFCQFPAEAPRVIPACKRLHPHSGWPQPLHPTPSPACPPRRNPQTKTQPPDFAKANKLLRQTFWHAQSKRLPSVLRLAILLDCATGKTSANSSCQCTFRDSHLAVNRKGIGLSFASPKIVPESSTNHVQEYTWNLS
jgi:hypothetical protein